MSTPLSRWRRSVATTLLGLSLPAVLGLGLLDDATDYVAMGDSYASGNGTGNPDLDLPCFVSSDAYPSLVAAASPGTDVTLAACSGARTADVIDLQATALSAQTDAVTLSVGGNDAGFSGLLQACLRETDDLRCVVTSVLVGLQAELELPVLLDSVYAVVRQRAEAAHVVVVGYPRIFGPDVSCAQAAGISAPEAVALNRVADLLDQVIDDRSRAAGFDYVSVIESFAGHDVCAPQPWVVGRRGTSLFDAYHPSVAGHRDGFAPLVDQALGATR